MFRSGRLLRNERGVTLMVVLVAVVVVGLSAGIAGTTWNTIMQQAREEQLLFAGDQYRRAIDSYYSAGTEGIGSYPMKLEDLLRDPRFPGKVRHLRRLYPDPMTGGDWELITDPGGRILGVRSTSTARPFKTKGFPEEFLKFERAKTYRGWEFVHKPETES